MRIYREYYGEHPPDGDMAHAYYQTLYSTPTAKQERSSNAMRAAGGSAIPAMTRFIVELGAC